MRTQLARLDIIYLEMLHNLKVLQRGGHCYRLNLKMDVCNLSTKLSDSGHNNEHEMPHKTLVLKCNDPQAVRLATNQLCQDKVIAIPTDTVYGFACSANSSTAIQRLYAIKGREQTKAVAICVATIRDVRYWGEANHLPDELLDRLLPGAVTIVLEKSKHLDNPHLNRGFSKIAMRIPDFEFIRDVATEFGSPIALTSANRSADASTLSVREFEALWPEMGIVLDGGILGLTEEQRSGSTIVDLSETGWCSIIRNGVAAQQTIAILAEFNIKIK